jgi:hypothetical protein
MDDASARSSGIRFDLLGVALMVGGLGLGLVNRALLPSADECRRISPVSPFLLSASVIAFGFGVVRCLTGPARRIGVVAMTVVTVALVALATVGAANLPTPDCG